MAANLPYPFWGNNFLQAAWQQYQLRLTQGGWASVSIQPNCFPDTLSSSHSYIGRVGQLFDGKALTNSGTEKANQIQYYSMGASAGQNLEAEFFSKGYCYLLISISKKKGRK